MDTVKMKLRSGKAYPVNRRGRKSTPHKQFKRIPLSMRRKKQVDIIVINMQTKPSQVSPRLNRVAAVEAAKKMLLMDKAMKDLDRELESEPDSPLSATLPTSGPNTPLVDESKTTSDKIKVAPTQLFWDKQLICKYQMDTKFAGFHEHNRSLRFEASTEIYAGFQLPSIPMPGCFGTTHPTYYDIAVDMAAYEFTEDDLDSLGRLVDVDISQFLADNY